VRELSDLKTVLSNPWTKFWALASKEDLLGETKIEVQQPRVVEQPAVRRRAVGNEHTAFIIQESRNTPTASAMQQVS
jgi:hypothetical protein